MKPEEPGAWWTACRVRLYVHPVRSFLFLHVITTPTVLNWLAILLVLLMEERRVFLVLPCGLSSLSQPV